MTIKLTEAQEGALRFIATKKNGCDSWDVGDAIGCELNIARAGASAATALWRKELVLKDRSICDGSAIWWISEEGRAWLAAKDKGEQS